MKKELGSHVHLTGITENLVDRIWKNRPKAVYKDISAHDVKFAGVSATEKLSKLRDAIKKKENAYGLIASALDDIAWLFNLRGSDVPMNPVFFSHAIVTLDTVVLYLHQDKLSSEVYFIHSCLF